MLKLELRKALLEKAEKLEEMADQLYCCDANFQRHVELSFKAMKLRKLAGGDSNE